jgi:hypothetical protein
VGYLTRVPYTVLSFFDVVIANQYVNEQLGNQQNVLNNNWQPSAPGYTLTDADGFFEDSICVSGPSLSPQETPPAGPLGTTLVYSVAQTWSVGYTTSGAGVPVQTDTIQHYIDHGAHAGIVTPLRGIGQ